MKHEPHFAESEHGLLLVGHGTRDVEGQNEFIQTACSVAGLLGRMAVEPCFLELAEPTIDVAIERLAAQGIRRLSVMPLLLFAAGHAKRDIPQAVGHAIRKIRLIDRLEPHAERPFAQLPPLGCHAKLLELSSLRFAEAVANRPAVAPEDTALVMVGRGSRDEDATAEMFSFARQRGERSPVDPVETCFVAMAEPPLGDCLERMAASDFRRVVIQPHLLFGGQLLARISDIVVQFARRHPDTEWVVARHLGPHALLDAAIVDVVTTELRDIAGGRR